MREGEIVKHIDDNKEHIVKDVAWTIKRNGSIIEIKIRDIKTGRETKKIYGKLIWASGDWISYDMFFGVGWIIIRKIAKKTLLIDLYNKDSWEYWAVKIKIRVEEGDEG